MNDTENIGFEDFETALFGDDYQTDTDDGEFEETETEDTEDGEEAEVSADDDSEADEEEEAEAEEETEDPDEGAEEDGEAEKPDAQQPQTFTLKVNKEEKTVTLDEMTALAQKGADYDRVKENYSKSQQTIQELQAKLTEASANQNAIDILNMIAEKSNASLDQLAESLYVNMRKSAGASEDAAREELKSAKLEKELNSYKSRKEEQKDDADSRAQRDMEDFRKEYPDVQLTKDLIQKMTADIQNGMTLTTAYRKYERAQEQARIAELERKLAAKTQNDKNKSRSPGSQKDSGARRARDTFADFMSEFN